jgi:hypothetical protein
LVEVTEPSGEVGRINLACSDRGVGYVPLKSPPVALSSMREGDCACRSRRPVEEADRQRTGPQEATVEPKTVQTLCLPSVVALSNP